MCYICHSIKGEIIVIPDPEVTTCYEKIARNIISYNNKKILNKLKLTLILLKILEIKLKLKFLQKVENIFKFQSFKTLLCVRYSLVGMFIGFRIHME